MRVTLMVAAASLGAMAPSASAQWWWPPQNGVSVAPACPSPSSVIDLEVGGTWNNSCRPNEATATVNGFEVDFVTERVPPPGFCLAVLTPWTLVRSVGPLPAGTYDVYATHVVSGAVVHPRTLIGSFDVSASCGCYADCDGDAALTLADFGCFQTKFALGDPYADCNGDLSLNLADFGCFQTEFAVGCP